MCTIKDDGLECDFSVHRLLALAGYSQLPEISGLGYYFRHFIDTKYREVETELMKDENGYFGQTDAKNMQSNYKSALELKARMPSISRLFTSSATANLKDFTSSATAKDKGGQTDWKELFVGEDKDDKKKIKHLTGVFLCSEEVELPQGEQATNKQSSHDDTQKRRNGTAKKRVSALCACFTIVCVSQLSAGRRNTLIR